MTEDDDDENEEHDDDPRWSAGQGGHFDDKNNEHDDDKYGVQCRGAVQGVEGNHWLSVRLLISSLIMDLIISFSSTIHPHHHHHLHHH